MSDDQAEPLEQPELLSVAEALTEHSAGVRASAYRAWRQLHYQAGASLFGYDLDAADGFTGGWSAALEWYIGLVTRPPLEQLARKQLAESVRIAAVQDGEDEHGGECGWLIRPLILAEYPQGVWCHAPEDHRGEHKLGH